LLGREAVGVCGERATATATATATGQRAGVWDEEEAIVMVFVGHPVGDAEGLRFSEALRVVT